MSQNPSWNPNERTVAKGFVGGALAVVAPVAGFASMTAAYALRNTHNPVWHTVPAAAGVACAVATVVGAVVCLSEIKKWSKSPPQTDMHDVQRLNTGMGDMTSMLGKTLEVNEGVSPENSVYQQQPQGMLGQQLSVAKDGR